MRRKILWITFWVTMAFWLGNAWGCQSARQDTYLDQVAETTSYSQIATPTSPIPVPQRSQWPLLTITPADSHTLHPQVYFHDLSIAPDATGQTDSYLVEDQLDAAMAGHTAGNWSLTNALATIVEPGKFVFDLVALPVKMIPAPPWSDTTTP